MSIKSDRPESFTRTARRAQIVTCAIEVIAEVGYPRASIRRIAGRLGIAMSAVLYHFGSKDNLIDAIVEHMYRAMLALVIPALNAETTATGKLNAYIRSSIAYFATQRLALVAIVTTATNYQSGDGRQFSELGLTPELAKQLEALNPTTILRAGQSTGEFGDFPAESMATALRGAVNAAVEHILRDPAYDARAYGEDLVEIFGCAVRGTR
jgi:AcrR family transcriptional regulator